MHAIYLVVNLADIEEFVSVSNVRHFFFLFFCFVLFISGGTAKTASDLIRQTNCSRML